MVGDTPFVCGGWNGNYVLACYALQDNGAWKQSSTSLSTPRYHPGYAVMKNQLVVVAGSCRGCSGDRTIEVLSPTTRSRTLPVTLPEDSSGKPCVVPWDEDTFMVIGGSDKNGGSNKTFFVNMVTNKLSNGPKLHFGGNGCACNEMTVNGETFIVVAGGTKMEVLSKSSKSNIWKRGNIFKKNNV